MSERTNEQEPQPEHQFTFSDTGFDAPSEEAEEANRDPASHPAKRRGVFRSGPARPTAGRGALGMGPPGSRRRGHALPALATMAHSTATTIAAGAFSRRSHVPPNARLDAPPAPNSAASAHAAHASPSGSSQ